jgi:leucyl aminopeptidase (aminopeptidase T)
MIENLSYVSAIRIALETCMGIKPGEEVLVVGDTKNLEIANSFLSVATTLGAEATLIVMKPRKQHGNEPPRTIASAMKKADVVLMPTSTSLSHTNAREEATKAGARIASMPTITREILEGPMNADYQVIKNKTLLMAEKVTEASKAKISTEKGTSLTLDLEGRKGLADTGILTEKGAFGNLPAGEAYCAPLEEKGNGTVVIDMVMAGIGKLSEPIKWEIRNGKVVSIEGGSEARELEAILKNADKNASKLAELGIGTNHEAKPMGNPLVDEKIMNTVHLAIGDNSHFGGKQKSEIHLDGIISQPTLELDDKVIIEKGEWKI